MKQFWQEHRSRLRGYIAKRVRERDAFRVLKAGGRLVISDIVATAELPEAAMRDLALYTGCMAGATPIPKLEAMLHAAGFGQVSITPKDTSRDFIRHWAP